MKQPVFTGSCVAIVTPFKADGVDYEKLRGLKLRMMRFMAKMTADQSKGKKLSAEEAEILRTLRQGGDFVMAKNLEEIEAWLDGVKA